MTDTQIPEKKPASTRPHVMSSRTGTLILSILIIITSMAYITYTLGYKIQRLSAETHALKQQQINTENQLASTIEMLSSTQTDLTDKLIMLNKNLTSALQERGYQNNDWQLLKARYYLELAEINAHWSENTQTTIALFQQADPLLINLHEPQLLAVRQAIAQEIAQVQAAPILDITGLLTQLDAAQHMVATLTPKNPFSLTKANPTPTTEIKSPSTWHEHLQASLRMLEKLVIIRHHGEAIQPQLTPAYEVILRENIRLSLQQAQWAVLQKNQAVYDLSLKQAIDKINQTFDPNILASQTLIKQLDDLQQKKLNAPKMAQGDALLLLNQVIDGKQSPVEGGNP